QNSELVLGRLLLSALPDPHLALAPADCECERHLTEAGNRPKCLQPITKWRVRRQGADGTPVAIVDHPAAPSTLHEAPRQRLQNSHVTDAHTLSDLPHRESLARQLEDSPALFDR